MGREAVVHCECRCGGRAGLGQITLSNEVSCLDDTVMPIVRCANAACKVNGLGLLCDQGINLLALPEASMLAIGQAEVDGFFLAWDDLKTEEAERRKPTRKQLEEVTMCRLAYLRP